MSEHVTTIEKARVQWMHDIIRDRKWKVERNLSRLNRDVKSVEPLVGADVREYWDRQVKEFEHQITELKSLEALLKDADSITVTRTQEEKNDVN